MERLLYLAHTESDATLAKAALEGLAAAVKLSADLALPLTVGLVGADVSAAANSIAGCGAERFVAVSGPEFGMARYSTDAAAAAAIVRAAGATVVLAPGTSRFARALPGATVRLGGRVDTRITALRTEGGLSVQRWFYRQRMVGTLSREERPWVLLLDPGIEPAWAGAPGQANVETLEVAVPETRTKVIGTEAASVGPQTIRPDAKLLFVAGAGWTKKQADGRPHVPEAESLIGAFLTTTQASLGSSKSLTDQTGEGQEIISFLTHLNQVGQTGSSPRHPKGLATCCHGEEPHVVGWRFVTERRAVNLDPNCGWAQGKADVVYVADAFAVMRKVNELLGG